LTGPDGVEQADRPVTRRASAIMESLASFMSISEFSRFTGICLGPAPNSSILPK
jgi:hypothetical protein